MAHPSYPPIITLKHFRKVDRPQGVLLHMKRDHPAAEILRAICLEPSKAFTTRELIARACLRGHSVAALEFWILQINSTLPRTGWRIRDDYRIERISEQHEIRLILKLGKAA